MAKKPVKAKAGVALEPPIEEPVAEPEPVVELAEQLLSEPTELDELVSLLAGHNSSPPEYLASVLQKANRLSRCSPTVQLAVLLMRADQFNMDE